MYILKEKYKEILKEKPDYKTVLKNAFIAFLCGGGLCFFGQVLIELLKKFNLEAETASSIMIIIIVLITAILSSIGIYDKIGQVARCGFLIPISGFSNSMVSSAMEYKSEGFLLGLSANVFKLAGSIIVLGTFFGFIVGMIKYIWGLL